MARRGAVSDKQPVTSDATSVLSDPNAAVSDSQAVMSDIGGVQFDRHAVMSDPNVNLSDQETTMSDKLIVPPEHAPLPPQQPKSVKYVIDRPVYGGNGARPHAVGSEQEFLAADVAHLVEAGFMHLVGSDPLPTAVGVGQQQISQPPGQVTVAPPMPASPNVSQPSATPPAPGPGR